MSLTYVIISLFRGDDIEQTEYLIGQLLSLSSQPRPILVFNGGYQPREQGWLERKYPGVKVLELPVPDEWAIGSEYHYFSYLCTQLSQYVDTEYYLKMDRDVCVVAEEFDRVLLHYMRERPHVTAAGILANVGRAVPAKLMFDDEKLFAGLPCPVSFRASLLLNGGIEVFHTSSMRRIMPVIEEYGRRIWQGGRCAIAEDDLVSSVLVGTGHTLDDCRYIGAFRGSASPPPQYGLDQVTWLKDYLAMKDKEFCLVHGFKPFVWYRSLYQQMHELLGREDLVATRENPNAWDECLLGKRPDYCERG